MHVQPNQTILRGKVQAIRPEPDGWGAEVDLEVEHNESPDPKADFLRPEPGKILKVFAAEPDALKVGQRVRAVAELNAGPFGGRAVIRSVEPAAPE